MTTIFSDLHHYTTYLNAERMHINRLLWILCIVMITGFIAKVRAENIIPVQEAKPVVLPCIVHQPNIDGKKVTWYKGKDIVSFDRNVIKFRTSLQVLPSPPPNEWNLKILRVTKEFEDEYTCKVKGEAYHMVRVVVEAVPEIIAPESSPLNVVVPEFTTARLYCKVSGYPQAKISWKRKSKGEDATTKDLGITTEELSVINATRHADDKYICLAENNYGSVEREISLDVHFPPEVMLFEKEAEVNIGEEVVMACIVQSSPVEDAFWTNKKGERLATNFKHIVDIEKEPVYPVRYMTLTLRPDSWDSDDYGPFSCNVSNGTVTEAKQFILKKPPKVNDSDETVFKYDVR